METAAQACARLMTALEALVDQEAACLRTRNFEAVLKIQRRAAPIVDFLAKNGPGIADDTLRKRVSALLVKRADSTEWLAGEIEKVRRQLDTLDTIKRKAARIAPAYGRRATSIGRLSVIG